MKTILISGASSGIGHATAKLLAAHGYRLSLSSRYAEKMSVLIGPNVIIKSVDVRNYAEVAAWINDTAAHFGGIDGLINNAGLGYFDTLAEGRIDQWHEMVDTNIKGVLNCLHAALPHLLKSPEARVINIASVAAHAVFPNSGVYCATKHAVLAMSDSLRTELGGIIRTTTISPGAVNTAFIDSTTNAGLRADLKENFASGMHPDLIASQVLHCLETPSDAVVSEIIIRPHRAPRK